MQSILMERDAKTNSAARALDIEELLTSPKGHIVATFTLDFSSSSKMALGALGGGGGRGLSAGRTGSCFTIPGREPAHVYFK